MNGIFEREGQVACDGHTWMVEFTFYRKQNLGNTASDVWQLGSTLLVEQSQHIQCIRRHKRQNKLCLISASNCEMFVGDAMLVLSHLGTGGLNAV